MGSFLTKPIKVTRLSDRGFVDQKIFEFIEKELQFFIKN